MRIMYVDLSTSGHHMSYLKALLDIESDSFAVLPKSGKEITEKRKEISDYNIRSFREYRIWMRELKRIADTEKPDIIHFLDGDSIMRYFGWGFSGFCNSKIVITFHHLFRGRLREISMRRMLYYAAAGVFHTEEITRQVRKFGCTNVETIEYPCFLKMDMREDVGISNNPKTLLTLGATRYDKGLDILLEALKLVIEPFELIIAGAEDVISKSYIEEQIKEYADSVIVDLRFLPEEQMVNYLQKSDIIVLPYRKVFDGASGPLCEGVFLGKTIIGPAHGSLCDLIKQNHLGYIFESENVGGLAQTISKALKETFVYDDVAEAYRASLHPQYFKEKYKELYNRIKE